ncbi:hypothetical protein GQX73_g5977 [Xylaria multiplex]|uniref:Uncharacterized protein n=1 Tax=Xylaria multiplex TaxID=323545 RepID=A0A7C8IMN4_9PEZI|nr:hypothetical protein GQX73_g5977 [Xylaria multiplex]
METRDRVPSCLSVDPHDDNITDPVLHYFGCLEAWQRESFFELASPYWVGEIRRHIQLKDSPTGYITTAEAKAAVIKKRDSWRRYCSNESQRVSRILNALSSDGNPSDLLTNLATSRRLWKSTREFQSGLERVRAWRSGRGMPNGVMMAPSSVATSEVYNPDDLTASIMAFEDGAPYNIDSQYVTGTFPDQNKPSTRFMRPFCQFIAPSKLWESPIESSKELMSMGEDPRHVKSETEKIVLFAPFLHWETSRQLTLITREIEEQQALNKSRQRQKDRSEKEQRKKQREGLATAELTSWWPFSNRVPSSNWVPSSNRVTFEDLLRELKIVEPRSKRFQSCNPLGQYLLDAARLYEEVRNYQDISLLKKYLFADSPLHPRRTLDQGYYTSPQITRLTDRNQVVYQATTPTESQYHRFDQRRGLWTCHVSSEGCEGCLKNIQKVSRVVMIDQLWMWILDQKTIITCFSKRYGVHGRDPSGVFEAIQRRLLRDTPIHSVMSVAQTILDECSNTFFDRRKDFSGQPQVLDIFSEAIRDVSRKQTLESHRLWNWIDRARRINRQQNPHWNLNMPDWDISAEGDLEQEIQGIIDELEIMISVNNTQLDVYKDFIQYTDRIAGGDHQLWLVDDEVRLGATRLIAKVEERVGYLNSLLKTSSNAANMVKDLSQLRQQQDSVVQAWQSVRLSLDSIDQGRTIMVFTIVTIIFSPLSFLSSIFGMNNAEFGDNQWKVSDQLKLICE